MLCGHLPLLVVEDTRWVVQDIESPGSREGLSQVGTEDRSEVPGKTWSDEWPRLRILEKRLMYGIRSAIWPKVMLFCRWCTERRMRRLLNEIAW